MADNSAQGAVATVKWEGDVLADTAAKCKEDLVGAFAASDTVVLDLSGCTQIEVPAIQLILAASIEAAKTGKKFSIAENIPAEASRAFELVGVSLANLTA